MNDVSKNHEYQSFIIRHRLLWLLLISVLGIMLDQGSKIWVQRYLAEPYKITEEEIVNGETKEISKEVFYPTRVLEIFENSFNIIYKENPAAAFSLAHSIPTWLRRPILIGVSFFAIVFFIAWYFRMRTPDKLLLISFSFILAGALGNLLDRVRLGYVIDFFDFHLGFLGYSHLHWPTFNIADTFIVLGALGVIFRTFKPLEPERIS